MDISPTSLLQLEQKILDTLQPYIHTMQLTWQNPKQISLDKDGKPITMESVLFEHQLRIALGMLLPQAGFIVEEGFENKTYEYNWTIDAINNTRNFVAHLPLFFIQVALLYHSEPLVCVIVNPTTNQVFTASKGNGVRYNGATISQFQQKPLSEAIIDVDLGSSEGWEWKKFIFEKLLKQVGRIRSTGFAFSGYLATNAIDGFLILNQTTSLPDMAPRILIAKELGLTVGKITKKRLLLAAPSHMYETLESIINEPFV